jgi:hypothetical protein
MIKNDITNYLNDYSSFKKRLFFYTVLFIYTIYHLLTLSYSPLVWQDETFFNSITLDFIQNNTFFLTSCPLFLNGQEVIYYGPIFFLINSWIIELFGNNPFQGRLLGLLAGIILIIVIHIHFSKKKLPNAFLYYLIIIAFIHDPFFNSSLHKGRNDTIALLFYFLAVFILLNIKSEKIAFTKHLLSGALFAFSILTTIRLVVFILPIFIIFLIKAYYNKKLRKVYLQRIFIWLSIMLLIFSFWVYYAFGNYNNFLIYFVTLAQHLPAHLVGNLFVPYEVVILLLCTAVVCFSILYNDIKILTNTSFAFSLAYLATFYIFIGDVGPYSILVIPIFYFLIIELTSYGHLKYKKNKFIYLSIFSLLIFNLTWFYIKAVAITVNNSSRNYSTVTNFIKLHIPPNSKVIGDEMYYYAIINNNCKFQYINLHINDVRKIEKYRRTVFEYEFLVLSNRLANSNPNLLKLYTDNQRLEVVGELKSNNSLLLNFFSQFGIYDFSKEGYNGKIYQRIEINN